MEIQHATARGVSASASAFLSWKSPGEFGGTRGGLANLSRVSRFGEARKEASLVTGEHEPGFAVPVELCGFCLDRPHSPVTVNTPTRDVNIHRLSIDGHIKSTHATPALQRRGVRFAQ